MQDVIFKAKECYAGIMVKTKYRIPKHLNSIVFIYYFGKLFGLLPIQYKPSRRRSRFYTDPGKFRGSKLGILLSFAQFMIESWTFYVVTKYLLESAMMRTEALCSQGNYCSAFGLLLSHTVIALLVILIVPLRYKSTIVCFNQANQILFNRRIKQNLSVTYYSLLPFTFSIIVKIIISNIGFYIKEPELYYPYNLAYFGPIIIINVVGVLCCICEQEYDEINQEIKQLCSKDVNKKYKTEKLKLLMDDHWFATNFLDNISKCFAVDLFLIMIDIYVQLVLFLYVTLWSMFAQKVFSGHIWPHAAGLLEVMIILVKLVYLCYRCDRAVAKGNFTLFHLRHLSTVTTYDFDIQPVIKIFTLKLNSRDIMITAYGFFTINLALLVRIIGAVLTYFLVLIQFQVDGETSMATTSPPTKNCPSWPCLKPSK